MNAIIVSCVASSSPYLLKIALLEDHEGTRHWADVVRAMEEKHQSINNSSMKLETTAPIILVRRIVEMLLDVLDDTNSILTPRHIFLSSIIRWIFGFIPLEKSLESLSRITEMP